MEVRALEIVDVTNDGHSHSINDLERINTEKFVSVGDDKRIITWNFNLLAE